MKLTKQGRSALLCVVSLVLCFEAARVSAQQVSAQPTTPSAQNTGETQSLEEVLVTAEKRSERLIDVPYTVTSENAAQLEDMGVTSMIDLRNAVSGLMIDKTGVWNEPSIRGVSTSVTGPGNDANVAVYIDGAYQPVQAANSFDLPDLSRVEVLKGPQGTLFGRNVTGGAIQLFTQDPTNTLTGHATVGYGSYNDVIAKGFLSGPIAPTLAGSISESYSSTSGYFTNVATGETVGARWSNAVRGKLLFTPTDDLRILLTGYVNDRNDPTGLIGHPINGNTNAVLFDPSVVLPTGPWQVSINPGMPEPTVRVRQAGGTLRADLTLPFATLTSLSTYGTATLNIDFDSDYTAVNTPGGFATINYPDQNASQEFDLVSNQLGRFRFVAGLFYYYDSTYENPLIVEQTPELVDAFFRTGATIHSYAGFGEATFSITDKLELTGGLRYTNETHTARGAIGVPGALPPSNIDDLPLIGTHTWTDTTPRASLRYKFDDNTSAYATYSTGFKAGTYDSVYDAAVGSHSYVNPETLTAYEIGIKSAYQKTALNASVFYYDYKNEQVDALQFINGAALTQLFNAAASRMYGVDLDGSAQVAPGLSLRGDVEYLHATFTSFPNASVNVPTAPCPAPFAYCGNTTITENVTGNELIRAPQLSGSVTGTYTKPFTNGVASLDLNVYYSDRYYFDFADRVRQPAYATLNAQVSWAPSGSRWKFNLWGHNLTDTAVIISTTIATGADAAAIGPPRMVGVSADVSL
jgi:iron complex outermembrane receptor protein